MPPVNPENSGILYEKRGRREGGEGRRGEERRAERW